MWDKAEILPAIFVGLFLIVGSGVMATSETLWCQQSAAIDVVATTNLGD